MPISPKKHILDLYRSPNTFQKRSEYLRMDKNENIIGFSGEVINDIRNMISSEFLTAYPEVDPLYQKLSENLEVDSTQIFLSAGSDAGIKSVFEVYVEPDDEVLILNPTYAMYYVYADMFQARLIKADYDKNLSLSADNIINSISSKTKLVCLANPNSPTGTLLPLEDIQRIIIAANNHDAMVLIDEAYCQFSGETTIGFLETYENLIITQTFSKAFGAASARLGFVLSTPSVIANLFKVRPMYEVNSFAVQLGNYFLEHPELVADHVDQINKSKHFLEKEMLKDGYSMPPSYTNFALIHVGDREKSKEIVRLLFDEKIIIKGGFEEPCMQPFIRVGIGSADQMKFFVEKFRRVLPRINK
jgi:histidinol-phosphate aminotransferase